MKIFYAENQPDYSSYTFNYAIYCIKENQAELPDIYAKGFLPYTGNVSIDKDVFYLARSLRVDLPRFEDTSENRRINRKVEPLEIDLQVIPKEKKHTQSGAFFDFCNNYASNRFSGNAMTPERLKYIFSRQTGSHIFSYSIKNKAVGYVLTAIEGNTLHYWFAFFDTDYMKDYSLGKWMMWRTIWWAKENKLDYVYLGTCYGESALYKVRNHKGLAFFDGAKWNPDAKLLKQLCKSDATLLPFDRFKLLDNPNLFIDHLSSDE